MRSVCCALCAVCTGTYNIHTFRHAENNKCCCIEYYNEEEVCRFKSARPSTMGALHILLAQAEATNQFVVGRRHRSLTCATSGVRQLVRSIFRIRFRLFELHTKQAGHGPPIHTYTLSTLNDFFIFRHHTRIVYVRFESRGGGMHSQQSQKRRTNEQVERHTAETNADSSGLWWHTNQTAKVGERTPIKVKFIVYAILFYACML